MRLPVQVQQLAWAKGNEEQQDPEKVAHTRAVWEVCRGNKAALYMVVADKREGKLFPEHTLLHKDRHRECSVLGWRRRRNRR